MKCDCIETDESHKSGRKILRCRRYGCKQFGLMPPLSGDVGQLHMDCQGWPYSHEWGHWLTLILEAFFITKSSWLRLKTLCGFKPQCGCEQRETRLNRLGARVAGWFR